MPAVLGLRGGAWVELNLAANGTCPMVVGSNVITAQL